MAIFPFSVALAAGATVDVADGWNYQYIPKNGAIKCLARATAVGILGTFQATARTLLQDSPVQAGGTAGVTPSDFTTQGTIAKVKGGERMSFRFRNPTGGAITIDGFLEYQAPGID